MFLLSQSKKGRKGAMAGVDTKLVKKEAELRKNWINSQSGKENRKQNKIFSTKALHCHQVMMILILNHFQQRKNLGVLF